MENQHAVLKKVAVVVSICSCFTMFAFITLLKVWDSGQPARVAAASAGLTIALGFTTLLLLEISRQKKMVG